jgi:hypothetical protein
MGFMGHIEYRHESSRTGGAQYGLGISADEDALIVFADAFDRDADAEDFSLEAIIAHECGHQLLARNRRLKRNLPRTWSDAAEEIVASLLASLLVTAAKDREDLVAKAIFEADRSGMEAERITLFILELRELLEELL